MAGSLYGAAQPDLDQIDQTAGALPIDAGVAYRTSFARAFNPMPAVHMLASAGEQQQQLDQVNAGGPAQAPQTLTSEDANARFGVPGYLRFNSDVEPGDAAAQQYMAQSRKFDAEVLSSTHPNPLLNFGASLAGGVVNPANAALMFATDGFGEAAMAGTGLRAAIDAGVSSRVGRAALATLGEGGFAQLPFVGLNAAEAASQGDDYGMGDALRDIAAGAILHTSIHYGLRMFGRTPDDPNASLLEDRPTSTPAEMPETDFTPASGVPEMVNELPPLARQGGWGKAVDDMAADRPVDVGQYVDRELTPPDPSALDEATAAPAIDSWRPLDEATAVTPRGAEIPVRYGLAELGDLSTSHADDLQQNPDYPQELQPRDRERAGAQARNFQLESELNPKLLMTDVSAAGGTPIVAPDGVVESGNGRAIALRRSAANNGAAYARYKAELAAQGFDTAGMDKPVLVRMRTQAMEGGARAALAQEMNADVTERMSPTEQATVDAGRLRDQDFDQIGDHQTPTSSPAFARAFIARAASDQVGSLTDAEGRLSPDGARRIKAAVLARAYGDPRLVGQIFEGEETPARKLGEALADAAPAWARMRALAARGDIPRELDLTEPLQSAMDLVRHAKDQGLDLGELIGARLDQGELFAGGAVSPYTEAFLRLFFRDAEFKRPTPADKITAALKDYARQASEVTPGPDLFGDQADASTARDILRAAAERYAQGPDPAALDIQRPPGKSKPGSQPARPAVVDLRAPGQGRDGGGGDVSQPGGTGADGAGGRPGAEGDAGEGQAQPGGAEAFIAADPELKALRDETDALARAHGVEPPAPAEKDQPNTIAEAIRAAATCLLGEVE